MIRLPAAPADTIISAPVITPAAKLQSGTDPFQSIRDLQTRMDKSFEQIFQEFYAEPKFNIFKDNPGYSLSLDVRDLKDHYEVRAYLPDSKTPDVHVSLKNRQTLDVSVSSKQTTKSSDQKNGASEVSELGQCEQMIELPSPVKSDQMKVKHVGQELVIHHSQDMNLRRTGLMEHLLKEEKHRTLVSHSSQFLPYEFVFLDMLERFVIFWIVFTSSSSPA